MSRRILTQPGHRLLAALLLFALPAMASAESSHSLLGSEGELYQVSSGRYDQLFEESAGSAGDHHVLALDVVWPDREPERLLIPGTENAAVESSFSISLERSSGTLFVTWEATQTIHSELYIVSRDEDGWSEVLEFSGNPFTTKANPRLSVTRESFLETDGLEGGVSEQSETILHLTWWDQQGSLGRILWAPLMVSEEGLIPIAPTDLATFIDEELPVSDQPPNESLARAPYIQTGSHQSEVIVSYIDPASGRLVTLSLQLSGSTIDSIGDEARAQVIIFGSEAPSRSLLAEALRNELTAYGSSVTDEAFAEYLSQKAAESILEAAPEATLESMAEGARAQVIIFGSRVRGSLTHATGEARAQVIIFGDNHPGLEVGRSIAITLLNHREAPAVPEQASVQTLVSPDGMTTIVAWEADGRLVYIESQGDEWGQERSLILSDDLDLERAMIILQRRLLS